MNIRLTTLHFSKIAYQYVIVLLSLIILSIIIEKGQDVLWINGLNNTFLDVFFPVITNLGDGLIFLPITIILLFVGFRYAIMSTLIAILSALISNLFKHYLYPGLDRPKRLIDNDLLHFVQGIEVHGAHTFPSGHTMTAFCAALFISFISKNKIMSTFALLVALLVGYSRIYLLQHFLVDVTAGAIIGCLSTHLIWQLFESFKNPDWMNKRISINIKQGQQEQLDRAS